MSFPQTADQVVERLDQIMVRTDLLRVEDAADPNLIKIRMVLEQMPEPHSINGRTLDIGGAVDPDGRQDEGQSAACA